MVLKISDRSYSVHYRTGLVALESHTCFNQLVIPNIDSKVEFLELFLKSLLNVGTGWCGVAGRQIRRKRIGKTKTKPLKKIKKTKRERVKKKIKVERIRQKKMKRL